MQAEIVVPRLGWSMDEGTFRGWLKKPGETVREGDPLFALEGDKATEEIAALDAGTLSISPDGPSDGDVVRVGLVIGYLGSGEVAPRVAPANTQVQSSSESPTGGVVVHTAPPGAMTPSRARRALSTPRARRVAAELGIEWQSLQGTGSAGRVREADIRAAAASRATRRPSTSPPRELPRGQRIPISTTRRAIADRLTASRETTAPVTLMTTVDAENLVALRTQFKHVQGDAAPTYTDLLIKLTALVLREHPMLRARWEGDHLFVPDGVNIALAVDTDAGLLVPVVLDVPELALSQLARLTRDLVGRARTGKLSAAEMSGACFTVSNLGAEGVEGFTPILPGDSGAILGVGSIRREAAVQGDRVVPRHKLSLSLTFDHRVVDGAPAGRFLKALRAAIENPAPWLIG